MSDNNTNQPEKVCPIQSDGKEEIKCCQHRCQLWIEVYTTELHRHEGCAIALKPQMVDGRFRV